MHTHTKIRSLWSIFHEQQTRCVQYETLMRPINTPEAITHVSYTYIAVP